MSESEPQDGAASGREPKATEPEADATATDQVPALRRARDAPRVPHETAVQAIRSAASAEIIVAMSLILLATDLFLNGSQEILLGSR